MNIFSGRALEELRGSLYNELRTSEGAKRQQQRYCGPFVAMSFNFMVAVGIILGNKLVCIFFLVFSRFLFLLGSVFLLLVYFYFQALAQCMSSSRNVNFVIFNLMIFVSFALIHFNNIIGYGESWI